jgi:hypothetical protein
MYSLNFSFLIALNFDKEIGSNPTFSPIAFTSSNMSFYFVPVGRTFSTTFLPVVSVRILCGIASARGTMMVARVAIACLVASRGFFKPTFPWCQDRRPSLV